MKRALLITHLLIISASSIFAQQHHVVKIKTKEVKPGFLLQLGFGYAFPHAGQVFGPYTPYSGTVNYANSGATYDSYDLKKASFSSGLQFTIGGKYMFSSHIGVQLDANIGLLPKKYTYNGTNAPLYSRIGNITVDQQAKMPVMLLPALVLQTGAANYNLYGRLGLAVPLYTRIDYKETSVFTSGPYTNGAEIDEVNIRFKYKFNIGLAGALGISRNLNNKTSFFIELTALSMSLYPKEAQYKSLSVNGSAYPGSIPSTYFGLSGSNVNPSNVTGTQMTDAMPFSNIGINAGLSFKL